VTGTGHGRLFYFFNPVWRIYKGGGVVKGLFVWPLFRVAIRYWWHSVEGQ
jgi:hypothetical protein